jgi:LmbE family N-acetylglucosaminyl deacetylase
VSIGALMASAAADDYEVEVLAVTDGEASHPLSTRITPQQMRQVRDLETLAAYRALGLHPARFRLGLPDSRVADHIPALVQVISIRLSGASAVVCPLPDDGPDAAAVCEATIGVARGLGVPCWGFALWARQHADWTPPEPPRTFAFPGSVLSRKRRAISLLESQVRPLGPGTHDGPNLSAALLAHFEQPFEHVWRCA